MSGEITYRALESHTDFEALIELQKVVWSMGLLDAVPPHMFRAFTHTGGRVFGAEHQGHMIGFVITMLTNRDGGKTLWSDMAGVHPKYQGMGIGYQLKQEQRKWALEHGYERICWTFNPLIRGNCNFNLKRLGVVGVSFRTNFYGQLNDDLNAGLPSDRLEVCWELRGKVHTYRRSQRHILLEYDNDEFVQLPIGNHKDCIVEIPRNYNELRDTNKDFLSEWLFAFRGVMVSAFKRGYQVVDFLEADDRCWHVLAHKEDTR